MGERLGHREVHVQWYELVRSRFASNLGESCCNVGKTDFIGGYFELETSGVLDVVEHPEGVHPNIFEGDERKFAVLYMDRAS